MRLDLGGRINAPCGYQTLDKIPPADIVLDLESISPEDRARYSGRFEEIRAHHVLEHINNLCPLMDTLWEWLEPNGILDIEVPAWPHPSAVHDPTHVRFFTADTFSYFTWLKYFNYVEHFWEYAQKPEVCGANKDCLSVKLKKVVG